MGDKKKRKGGPSQKKRFKKSVTHMLETRNLSKIQETLNENHVNTSRGEEEEAVGNSDKDKASKMENLTTQNLVMLLFPTGTLPNRSTNPNPNFRGQIQDWSEKRKGDLAIYLREMTLRIVEIIYPQDVTSGLRLLVEDIRFSKSVGYDPSRIDYGSKRGMAMNTEICHCYLLKN
jgi:hypothetical protein